MAVKKHPQQAFPAHKMPAEQKRLLIVVEDGGYQLKKSELEK